MLHHIWRVYEPARPAPGPAFLPGFIVLQHDRICQAHFPLQAEFYCSLSDSPLRAASKCRAMLCYAVTLRSGPVRRSIRRASNSGRKTLLIKWKPNTVAGDSPPSPSSPPSPCSSSSSPVPAPPSAAASSSSISATGCLRRGLGASLYHALVQLEAAGTCKRKKSASWNHLNLETTNYRWPHRWTHRGRGTYRAAGTMDDYIHGRQGALWMITSMDATEGGEQQHALSRSLATYVLDIALYFRIVASLSWSSSKPPAHANEKS